MKKYFTLLVFLLFIAACNKKKEPTYVYLDAYTKDHFYFKPGSYWIYRDSISGRVDSFYLNASKLKLNYLDIKLYNHIVETLNLDIVQKNSDPSIKDSLNWNYDFTTNYITAKHNRNNHTVTSTIGKFFAPQELKLTYHGGGSTHLSSVNIGNLGLVSYPHKGVWSISFQDSFASNGSLIYRTDYFYNDTVGFIKMRINYDDGKTKINEVWELQRWHIVKQ